MKFKYKRMIEIIILLVVMCLPHKVLAASVGVNCPGSVMVGDTIKCTVTGYHTSLAGLKAGVSYSGMDFVSVDNLTGSNMFTVSGSELDGAFDIASSSKSLATYTFKANSAGTATFNVSCQQIIDGTDFSSVSCTGVNKSITINNKPVVVTPSTPSTPTTPVVRNSDATLKGIELSAGNIDFERNKYDYDLEVDYNVETIDIKGILNDSKATVRLEGNTKLNVGKNVLKLNVVAEDGVTKKTYTLNIQRNSKILSKNNVIKNLKISNYNIDFKPDKKEYNLTISNEDYLTITVELEDEFAKYKILGNKDLQDGSMIKIKVTAEDGSTNSYRIYISKEANLTNVLRCFLIISVLLNVLLVAVLIIFIKKRNKNIVASDVI